jgi:hypothetical protein
MGVPGVDLIIGVCVPVPAMGFGFSGSSTSPNLFLGRYAGGYHKEKMLMAKSMGTASRT